MKASSSERSWAAHREDQAAFAEHSQVLMVSKAECSVATVSKFKAFQKGLKDSVSALT